MLKTITLSYLLSRKIPRTQSLHFLKQIAHGLIQSSRKYHETRRIIPRNKIVFQLHFTVRFMISRPAQHWSAWKIWIFITCPSSELCDSKPTHLAFHVVWYLFFVWTFHYIRVYTVSQREIRPRKNINTPIALLISKYEKENEKKSITLFLVLVVLISARHRIGVKAWKGSIIHICEWLAWSALARIIFFDVAFYLINK